MMGTTSSITMQSLGEDRTMRAGCRCENVVPFTHRPKIRFSPRRDDSLDRFPKFVGAFIRLTILRQCFKFHVIRITGYGVIVEKPRVGKLGQIFPCTL